ncbi:MAG: D-alanyl-D-alanine carboxypeptidase/D-alanyl-D-alanine-endopeptidase, partial [Candidatus Kapaibacterium sp.]
LNNLRVQIDDILSTRGRTAISAKIVFFEPNDSVHPVYSLNPDESVLPASTEKLFTSSSTLWALGSKYEFTTKLDLAPGSKIESSRVVGNVYLRPSGDPTLRSSDLDDLAAQLRAKGITSIQGDIVSDLDGENPLSDQAKEYLASRQSSAISVHDSIVGDNGIITSADTASMDSSESDDEDGEAGALSMFPNFSLDRNIITLTVVGGYSKGSLASVRVYPPIASVVVSNNARSSAPATFRVRRVGRGRHRRTIRTMSRGVMTLRVTSSGGPIDPQQTISITGQIPARSQRTYSIAIRNVPMAMAGVMKWRLQRDGISVTGQPRVDRAPANHVLETIAEKKTNLVDLLEYMNKRSDNYLAESMFRKLSTIAQVAANAPDERARTLMHSWLQVCNVNGTACTFIDGSGLSKEDRVTANTVIDLLAAIKQRGMFPLFTHTLSVAGYDGTLRHRMIGTAAQYNAHGKTGTLNYVTVLAGYVVTGDGQLAAYFITMQNFRGGPWSYKREQDKVVEALANFKYADYQTSTPDPLLFRN